MNYQHTISTTKVIQFTIVLIGTGISAGQNISCSDSWELFYNEDVCLEFSTQRTSWSDARAFCQDLGGDLVQIWSKDKEMFIKGMGTFSNARYWIGVSDRDRDGTYEYANRTKLNTSSPGLGEWSDQKWNKYDVQVEQCVILLWRPHGWESFPCNSSESFICEKNRLPMEISENPSQCEYCSCNPDDWAYFRQGDKYINAFKGARNYSTAASMCERLGGQLLTVSDAKTRNFVKNGIQWDHKGVFYWMGLANKDDNVFTWIDGTDLDTGDYQTWFRIPSDGQYCVAVIWDYDAKWRATDCNTENYYVCEAQEPCTISPLISVDDKTIKGNFNAEMVSVQTGSVIKCLFRGVPENIWKVQLNCGLDTNYTASGKRLANMTIHFGIDMHGEKCVCRLILEDRSEKETQFTMNYKTSPLLVDEDDNNTIIQMTTGLGMVLSFTVYANPTPTVHSLTKTGFESSTERYIVTITPLTNILQHTVLITLDEFGPTQSGTYSLVLENGMDEKMNFVFHVAETLPATDVLKMHPSNVAVLTVFGTMLVAGVLVSILMFLKARYGFQSKGNKETQEECSRSLDTEHENDKSEP